MLLETENANTLEIYKLLIGSVLPRPIAWVSSCSSDGVLNLAPFSFFTIASVNPPVLCFAPLLKPDPDGHSGAVKDTVANIEETGEFVVNIVSRALAEKMNQTCGNYGPEVDEFEVAHLSKRGSKLISVPRVAEALVSMECKVREVMRFGQSPMAGSFVLGDILCIHVDDHIYQQGRINTELLEPIGRLAGDAYTTVKDQFNLARPKV